MDELILDKKRLLKGLLISLAIGIIVVLIIITVTTNKNTWASFSNVDKKYLFLACVLMVFAALIDALRIKMSVEAVSEKITFLEALKTYYISNFAGTITPFFSGTIPAQIYLFNKNIKNKIPLGKATMIATIIPMLKTLVFTVITPIIFFYFRRTITNYTTFSIILIDMAILFSLVLLSLFILAAKYPEKIIKIIINIQKLPYICKLFKKDKLSKLTNKLFLEIREFRKSFYFLRKNWFKLFLAIFYTIIFWGNFFLVAPFILKGFNIDFDFANILATQVIFYFILPFMPTPGGSGTAEAGFASLFSFFVPQHLLGLFVGTWRFTVFYLNMIIGLIVLLIELKKSKKKEETI